MRGEPPFIAPPGDQMSRIVTRAIFRDAPPRGKDRGPAGATGITVADPCSGVLRAPEPGEQNDESDLPYA